MSGIQKYEYYLHFWGEVENENWIERDLGIREKCFWFDSVEEREALWSKLSATAKAHRVCIVYNTAEGTDTRKRTIATMTLCLPDGREFPYRYDFGYAYPIDAAEYMFEEGNYSCDCSHSLFLSQAYPEAEIPEAPCGDTIRMQDFKVVSE